MLTIQFIHIFKVIFITLIPNPSTIYHCPSTLPPYDFFGTTSCTFSFGTKGLFWKHYWQGWKHFDFRWRNLGVRPPRISRIWVPPSRIDRIWAFPHYIFKNTIYMCSMVLFELFQVILIISIWQNLPPPSWKIVPFKSLHPPLSNIFWTVPNTWPMRMGVD